MKENKYTYKEVATILDLPYSIVNTTIHNHNLGKWSIEGSRPKKLLSEKDLEYLRKWKETRKKRVNVECPDVFDDSMNYIGTMYIQKRQRKKARDIKEGKSYFILKNNALTYIKGEEQ